MEIIFRAVDGKEFNNRWDCLRYEQELEEKQREIEHQKIKEFYVTFSNDFFPESDYDVSKFEFSTTLSWLTQDLKYLCRTKTKEELQNYFISKGINEELSKYIEWGDIENDAKIRNDFATALRKCKRGTQLSSWIGYALSKQDVSNLARLHKSNKFRKKIEDLLTDCNFHYECGKFMNKEYDEFLKEEE